MKKVTSLLALFFLSISALAQPTDLFISEYVEGSSFNKALELYNGTNASIDMTSGQYILEVYFNGSLSSTSLAITGTVAPGGVFILAHPSATLGVTPNVTTTVVNFNGDDAIVIRKGGGSGPVVDVIGQVGFDPGTQWGLNDTSTLDRTLRRKITVCQGDVSTSNLFYTEPEWDGFPQNTFNGLGSHTVSCGPISNGLSVAPASLNFTTTPNVASSSQTYAVTGNSLTLPVDIIAPPFFELALIAAGPFTSSISIPSASFGSGPVTVYVRYSPITIGNNSGIATHSSNPHSANLNLSGSAIGILTIAQIQGTAAASPYATQVVTTSGVVTADFQGPNELGGFFIQDPIGDNNPLSSEGIFVYNTSFSVNVGDVVTVTGTAEEYYNKTQIRSVTAVNVQTTGATVAPVSVTLPFATMTEPEKWEGMRVQLTQTLTVTDVYTLARYGEVELSVNGRLFTPTNFVDPNDQPASGTSSSGSGNVAAVIAQQTTNNLSRILLDDKSSVQNPPVVPYVDAVNNTLRCGSTVNLINGIMDFDFSVYRIQPVEVPLFNYAVRPAVPAVGNSTAKVASFNVLNYFNGDGMGGGFPTSRGANTAAEFTRQRTKIIEAIKQLNADAVGLMEMENDGNGPQSAIQDLVNGLNTSIGATTYTFVEDPTAANGGTGTDEIKVALIYKPSVLTPVGLAMADNNAVNNRPPLAQTFSLNGTSEKFSVVVNHMKSKGCTGATGNNTDQNDGQSCFNSTRKNQATQLLTFITTIVTQSGDNDVLVIGDLNSYEQEDPIDLLLAGGLTNLLNNVYSYVFDGQSGSLDHALISSTLLNQVTGADKWHINADEPIAKDYNQEFNPAYLYDVSPFRSSDHDPVIIGLDLKPLATGINSLKKEESFQVILTPNPTSQSFVNLALVVDKASTAKMEMIDQLGKVVYSHTASLVKGNNNLGMAFPELAVGLYYVKVSVDGRTTTQKLVISH